MVKVKLTQTYTNIKYGTGIIFNKFIIGSAKPPLRMIIQES